MIYQNEELTCTALNILSRANEITNQCSILIFKQSFIGKTFGDSIRLQD